MKMKVDIIGTLDFPDVVLQPELRKIAKKVVIPLLKEGILTGTDIRGRSFPKLSVATKKRKGHSRPLQDEGILFESFKAKKDGEQGIIVYIKRQRKKIAKYLQIDGIGKAKKKFEFMGVTEGMEKDAMAMMQKFIKKYIRKAMKNAVR